MAHGMLAVGFAAWCGAPQRQRLYILLAACCGSVSISTDGMDWRSAARHLG